MRNLEFYKDKMTQSTSLSDLEKAVVGAKGLLDSEVKSIQTKRQNLVDKIKNLDNQIAEKRTIEASIESDFREKASQIMSNLTSQKKRGRKPKQS